MVSMSLKKLFLIFLIIAIIVSMMSIVSATDIKDITSKSVASYDIKYFDKNVAGDVLKNSKISKNLPNSTLSKKIASMTKNGSVILKFGDGNGSKILICAGIHGDESAANIATLRLIENIKDKKIKGTIYVIPFIIPKSTAINKRSWYNPHNGSNVDPNRCVNVPGTPGYKIVQFAKKNNIEFIIDVHSGGGMSKYKKGLVIANKPSKREEKDWISYIKKNANPQIVYSFPDERYMQGYSKANNITAITLEVEKDKGSISQWAKIEYNMLINACKYFNLFGHA